MTITHITCDIRDWPLVVVRFPTRYSDAEFAVYLRELKSLASLDDARAWIAGQRSAARSRT